MAKGQVRLDNFRGRLHLRWSYAGKNYRPALGVPYEEQYFKLAEAIAQQIELDMIRGCFDESLASYIHPVKPKGHLTCPDLYNEWLSEYKHVWDSSTYLSYASFGRQFSEMIGNTSATSMTYYEAMALYSQLKERYSGRTIQSHLGKLSSAWNYGLDLNKVQENPWAKLLAVHTFTDNPPDPFTLAETKVILDAFQQHRSWYIFYPAIRFMFGIGCRLGECLGLQWQDYNDRAQTITFRRMLVMGQVKQPKTRTVRTVRLPDSLSGLLDSLRTTKQKPTDWIFTAREGGKIHGNHLSTISWKKGIMEPLDIRYRSIYQTRSTFISHCLEAGMSPPSICQITGHSVAVMYKHYAGFVGTAIPPEYLSGPDLDDNE